MSDWGLCRAPNQHETRGPAYWVYCTRPVGHEGPHIATIGPYRPDEIALAEWPADAEVIPPDVATNRGGLIRDDRESR